MRKTESPRCGLTRILLQRGPGLKSSLRTQNPKGKSYSTPAGDKAEEKAQAELLTLQAQLKTLEQHTSVNDVISKQRQDLWQTENQFTVLQEAAGRRQLTAQENPAGAQGRNARVQAAAGRPGR